LAKDGNADGTIVCKPLCLGILGFLLLFSAAMARADTATCGARGNCCDALDPGAGGCVPGAYQGTKLALVIGADAYSEAFKGDLSDLKNARNDALTVGDRFTELGFSVRYLLDPMKTRVNAELSALESYMRNKELDPKTTPKDARAVIYVAGHGMSFEGSEDLSGDYLIFRPEPEAARPVDKIFADGRLDTNTLRRKFHNLMHFDIFFLFDVCRSLQQLSRTADDELRGQKGGTFTQAPYDAGTSQMVTAFSTSENRTASDTSTVERQGLYVARWRELLAVAGLMPLEIMEITRFFTSRDGQTPSEVVSAAHKYRLPWASDQTRCQSMEKSIWSRTEECGSSLLAPHCLEALCNEYARSHYEGLRQSCLLPSLNTLLPGGLNELCRSQLLAPPQDPSPLIGRSTPTGTRAAVLALAAPALDPPLATGTRPEPPLTEPIAALPKSAFDRQRVEASRSQLLTKDIVSGAGTPLALKQSSPLYNLPNKKSPLILSNIPTEMTARLDCTNLTCDAGWVGVTTESAGTFTRGFVPYDAVNLNASEQTVVVDFDSESSTLDYIKLSLLITETEKAISQNATVRLTVFANAGEDTDSAVLRRAREMSLRRLILSVEYKGHRLSQKRLTVERVERPNFISAHRAIVEFKPATAEN
jgi:Caspase domain